MKKLTILIILALAVTTAAMAIPARPGKTQMRQPDGTTVTIALHGDEYLHFTTTDDGYTVVRDERGYYVYAALRDGELLPTTHVAHDQSLRDDREQSYLQGISKNLRPAMPAAVSQEKEAEQQRRALARAQRRAGRYDYTKMRGLIILVEYNDKTFSRDDYRQLADDFVNKEGYDGYVAANGRKVSCTGSVHDYYRDNSDGLFAPKFDIVGPVTIGYSQYYAQGNRYSRQLTDAALDAVDDEVDFSLYDGDDDGTVDMVYFIFAGCGSNIDGNDSRLLWPHASQIVDVNQFGQWTTVVKDGVRLGRYACSTEMTGAERSPTLDGIGTICHEFTHVLGLPDFYDTDYDETGGEADHPGRFDLMASGGYLNDGKTPCGYTLYERYVMGFAQPLLIADEGRYELPNLGENNTGYRINTPEQKVFFMLENRQRTKWDAYLPCFGMCVFRVDSTNNSVWSRNTVNVNPTHLYFQLLRAGGTIPSTTFPGVARVRELTRASSPASLLTWSGAATRLGLNDIQETDGVVSFNVFDTYLLHELALPAALVVGTGLTRVVTPTATPSYAYYKLTWATDDASVATVDQDGRVKGIGVGTAHITATSDNGLTATCTVTVEQQNTVADIARFVAMGEADEAMLLLHSAEVLFNYKNDVYVRDATGAIVLRNTGFSLAVGDRVEGFVYGQRTQENGMPVLAGIAGKSAQADLSITAGNEPEPRRLWMSDLNASYFCDLVTIQATQWEAGGGIWAVSGSRRVRLYNPFQVKNVSVPTNYGGKYYDVTGIYGTNVVSGDVILELKLLQSPVEVSAPAAITTVSADDAAPRASYNLKGQRVADGYRGIVVSQGKKKMFIK